MIIQAFPNICVYRNPWFLLRFQRSILLFLCVESIGLSYRKSGEYHHIFPYRVPIYVWLPVSHGLYFLYIVKIKDIQRRQSHILCIHDNGFGSLFYMSISDISDKCNSHNTHHRHTHIFEKILLSF